MVATEEAVPSWTMEKWQKDVFNQYFSCKILYENKEMLNVMNKINFGTQQEEEQNEWCCMTFSHAPTSKTINNYENKNNLDNIFVKNILSVLENGSAPPITKVHARRILEVPPYPGMKKIDIAKQVKTFDAGNFHCILFFLFKILSNTKFFFV